MRNLLEADDFGVMAMTEAINALPVVPQRIGSMNLFPEEGIPTTSVGIEMMGSTLKVIPVGVRGVMPQASSQPKRSLKSLEIPHLPKNDTINATQVQNVRGFGNDSEEAALEAVASVVNSRLAILKSEHELTWEWMRIRALQGQILDADGASIVVDYFDFFDVARITVNWNTASIDGLKNACLDLIEFTGTEATGTPVSRVHVLCGRDMWRKLVTSAETKDAFKLFQDSSFQRTQTFQAFEYAGVMFEPLMGKIGAVPFVPDAEGASFPVAPLYGRFNAPANFSEAVNTNGLPLYSKQEPLRFGTGYEIHTQSNPLFFCRKPRTLIRLTFSV